MMLSGLPDSSLPELSNRIAQIGEPACPILQQLVSSPDTRTSQFAFTTLLQIGNSNLPSETNTAIPNYKEQMRGTGTIDMSSLASLLMEPVTTIANLSKQLVGVPGVNVHLIKLMIR